MSCHMPKHGTGPWKAQDSSANQSQLSFGPIWTDSHVLCCCFWKAISWHVRYSKLGYLNLVSTLDTCILHTQTGAWLATCFLFKINTLTTCLGRGTVQSLAMPCSEGIWKTVITTDPLDSLQCLLCGVSLWMKKVSASIRSCHTCWEWAAKKNRIESRKPLSISLWLRCKKCWEHKKEHIGTF